MNIAFLKGVYCEVSNANIDTESRVTPMGQLRDRYLCLTETTEKGGLFHDMLGAALTDDADCLFSEIMTAYELQGFINGFRYASMLSSELSINLTGELWKQGTPPPIGAL